MLLVHTCVDIHYGRCAPLRTRVCAVSGIVCTEVTSHPRQSREQTRMRAHGKHEIHTLHLRRHVGTIHAYAQ
jgi:hypothetical protein